MALLATKATMQPITKSPSRARQRKWSRYSNRTFYLFASPWILGFLVLTVFPLIYALIISFTNFNGIATHLHWVGLANYAELLHDPDTLYSLGRTLLFTSLVVPLMVAGGVGLALLLNQQLRGIALFRAIFYLPSVVPVVAAAVAWETIFDHDTGAVNAIIEHFGGHAVAWLGDPTAFGVLILMVVWGVGGNMIISLAGLQGIPTELREAARVDGATSWQVLRSVILPLLSPVLFFEVITGVIYSFQMLIQPLLLAGSGTAAAAVSVPRSNTLYMVNVYIQFFYNQRFGYGSALLWVLFGVVLLITLLVFRSSSFWVYYQVDTERK